MKILFEDYQYRLADLRAIVGDGLSSWPCQYYGDQMRFDCVGYFYSKELEDAVFILPKVLLNLDDANHIVAFGMEQSPTEFIDFNSDKIKLVDTPIKEFIFKLAVWLYQAIRHYSIRKGSICSVDILSITDVKPDCASTKTVRTYLDIIIQLFQFHKEHKRLFTYVSLLKNTGNNRINWNKTVSLICPVISNKRPIYLNFINYKKEIDIHEELIVLFYSVLRFLQEKYYFRFDLTLNYELIPSKKIQTMIETSKGTRLLKKIKYNYFKDELVLLWKLLYAFFQKAEDLAHGKQHPERLLVRKFNNVFEDMIDWLLTNPSDRVPKELKEQPDGKLVDHIYLDHSLLSNKNDIFFIGDSKYYQDGSELGANSVYKQFTYAKNVIQFNVGVFSHGKTIDQLQSKRMEKAQRYRDEITEGYEVTPNFFIRGAMDFDDLTDVHDNLCKYGAVYVMSQFCNRLFDRDTLLLQTYTINFLFVLMSYISRSSNEQFRAKARRGFRNDIMDSLNARYDFYKASFKTMDELKDFVDAHFKPLNGKMFRDENASMEILFACEKIHDHEFPKEYGDVKLEKCPLDDC